MYLLLALFGLLLNIYVFFSTFKKDMTLFIHTVPERALVDLY